MFDINKFLNKLSKNAQSKTQVLVKEALMRDDVFNASYQKWCSLYDYRKFTDLVYNQYQLFISKEDPYDVQVIRFIKGRGLNGFVLRANPDRSDGYEDRELEFLLDYLKEKVIELRYISYVSDIRYYNREEYTETILRHYLKPSIKEVSSSAPDKANQLWGNINIELRKKDDKITQLKFLNTWYNDSNWTKAKDFDLLMAHLCAF